MGALRLNLRGAPPGSFSEVIFPSYTSGFAKVWPSVSWLSLSETFYIGVLHTLQIMNCLSSYMMPNPVVTSFMHSHRPKSSSFELKRQSLLMKLYACCVPVPLWNLQGSRLLNKYLMLLKNLFIRIIFHMFKYINQSLKKIFPYKLMQKSILIQKDQQLKITFLWKIKTAEYWIFNKYSKT